MTACSCRWRLPFSHLSTNRRQCGKNGRFLAVKKNAWQVICPVNQCIEFAMNRMTISIFFFHPPLAGEPDVVQCKCGLRLAHAETSLRVNWWIHKEPITQIRRHVKFDVSVNFGRHPKDERNDNERKTFMKFSEQQYFWHHRHPPHYDSQQTWALEYGTMQACKALLRRKWIKTLTTWVSASAVVVFLWVIVLRMNFHH